MEFKEVLQGTLLFGVLIAVIVGAFFSGFAVPAIVQNSVLNNDSISLSVNQFQNTSEGFTKKFDSKMKEFTATMPNFQQPNTDIITLFASAFGAAYALTILVAQMVIIDVPILIYQEITLVVNIFNDILSIQQDGGIVPNTFGSVVGLVKTVSALAVLLAGISISAGAVEFITGRKV